MADAFSTKANGMHGVTLTARTQKHVKESEKAQNEFQLT